MIRNDNPAGHTATQQRYDQNRSHALLRNMYEIRRLTDRRRNGAAQRLQSKPTTCESLDPAGQSSSRRIPGG